MVPQVSPKGGADVVGIANRIGDRKEANAFDIVSREQAEARSVRSVGDGVKDVGNKDVIYIHADLGVRSAHHAELSEEIIVGGGGNAGERLQRTERVVGEDCRGLAKFAAGEGKLAHRGPVFGFKDIPADFDAFRTAEVLGREIYVELLRFVLGFQLKRDFERTVANAAEAEKRNLPSGPVTVVMLVPRSATPILANGSPPWALVTMPITSAALAGSGKVSDVRRRKSPSVQLRRTCNRRRSRPTNCRVGPVTHFPFLQ